MREVEGEGHCEAEWESEDYPLVGSADAEHVFRESAEGDSLGYVQWFNAYEGREGLRYY